MMEDIIKRIYTGDSLVVLGAAGSGKSYLLRKIRDLIDCKYPGCFTFAMTAMTGVVAVELGGQTLHKYLGIPIDGETLTVDKMLLRLRGNGNMRKNWMMPGLILAIDEISMLSAELFDVLVGVSRALNNPIRWILCGDFYQLPPINGRWLFESAEFQLIAGKHPIILTTSYRHTPEVLAVMNELRSGDVSAASDELLRGLTGDVRVGAIEPTRLYALNVKVDDMNAAKLMELPGEMKTFMARDKGNPAAGTNVRLPEQLNLKIGAQVMCLVNYLDDETGTGLSNGSRGVVVGFEEIPGADGVKYPRVQYINGEERIMTPASIDIFEGRKSIFRRTQIPLRLSWAITIHKSQGLSIDLLEVDLAMTGRTPGQAYVAVSRATSLKGLRLINYDKRLFRTSPAVVEFMARLNAGSEPIYV
jgi:ATP-dependent DNA helicase PIF1